MRRLAIQILAIAVACTPAPRVSTSSATPTPIPSPSASSTASRPVLRSFTDIVQTAASATYRIAYAYRVVANAQTQTLESTWYVRPPEMRWDFTSPLGGTSSFFVLRDGVFVCSPAGQPSPGCVKLGSIAVAEQSSGAQVQELIRAHPERFTATAVTPREVASITAQCFDVNDVSGEFGTGTMCYSPLGLPLYSAFNGPSGQFSMEAKTISTTVTDADLALPGPVKLP